MKKTLYALVLATLVIFIIALPSYAARSGAHQGGYRTPGHPAMAARYGGHAGGRYGGHAGGRYGGHYGGWHGHYGGRGYYWGGSIVLGPWWYPWYPYPYSYYPAPQPYAPPPQVYVEPQQPQQSYWYYCQEPKGYYPYVQSCPGGWMKVLPQAPPPKQ